MNSKAGDLFLGALVLLLAFPLAFFIHVINNAFPGQAEKAVQITGALFLVLLALPPSAYLVLQRREANPGRLGLIMLATVGVLLGAIYMYWVSTYVFFPADILIWSESDFVNDIVKFRLGYPLYTAQVNNESFTYVPGPQLLTYFLAWVLGSPTSVPMYRAIQIGFTLLAAVFAALCVRTLLEISSPARMRGDKRFWSAAWLPILFLIATNSLTNPFVHALHDDALAQLFSVVAFYLLLMYVSTQDWRVLGLMAILPAIGFLIKQSMTIWAIFYCVQLALFDRPFSIKRLAIFGLGSFGAVGAVVLASYVVWGDPFIYWIFTVLGSHGVSPLRSFQHALDVWVYFVIGLLGGLALVRGKNLSPLLGPWLIWLSLISLETYTSGIAWMINHIGPGSLIAGIWFLAGLARFWSVIFPATRWRSSGQTWLRSGIAMIVLSLLFSGLGVVRIPLPPLSQDAYRYINDIEKQFQGQSKADILLDVGTWVYLKDGVIMKDRAPSIGERGYSETGDFSGIIQRLEQKRYSKILVRNLHSPEFWYDYGKWRKSSGIKWALLANYREAGKIAAVQRNSYDPDPGYLFDEIIVLVPNSK